MLYNNLVSPLELAQLLGHANAEMVYDVYVVYIDKFYVNFNRSINNGYVKKICNLKKGV